jgi:hypothetical protein
MWLLLVCRLFKHEITKKNQFQKILVLKSLCKIILLKHEKVSKVGDKLFKALKCKKHNYIKLMVLTPACKNIP